MAKTVGYPVEHQHSGEREAAPRKLRSRKAGNRRIIGRHHLLDFLDGAGSLADRPAG